MFNSYVGLPEGNWRQIFWFYGDFMICYGIFWWLKNDLNGDVYEDSTGFHGELLRISCGFNGDVQLI
jgi:hypothetical protein